MLHLKFPSNRSTSSGGGGGRFLIVFTTYGHGSHLGHVTSSIYIYTISPFLQMIRLKFGFDWPSGFREEDV